MWFIAILVLFNAWANNDLFVNEYRLEMFGLPINAFDGLIILGFIIALLRPRTSEGFVKTEKMHPALTWMLVLFPLAMLGGLIGAAANGATERQIITCLRNFLAAPAAVYLAYFLTANVKSSRKYLYLSVAAGLLVAFMIVVFFKEKTETRTQIRDSLNVARAVAYISTYAGLAMCLMFYSVASGMRLMPMVLAWVVMGACLIGQFTTLSRSDWLSAAAGLGAAFFLLPRDQRMKSAFRAALALPVLVASMWVGLYAGSAITGRNMYEKMEERFWSMMPGDRPGVKNKAWDTRLPGTFRELRMFASSPVIGGGFAIQDTPQMEGNYYMGLRHNTWTATLAETGILGFAAFVTLVGGMAVVGLRMVRARTDQTTVLIGAFGVMTASFFTMHGMCTMSFNQVRWGLPLFLACGVVLRTRQMQLALLRQAEEEQAYLEHHPEAYDYSMQPGGYEGVGQPALGGWYQTN